MHATSFGSKPRVGAIHVVPDGDEIVAVCLEGEFDLTNAPDLGEQISLELEGGNDLILDMSEATFIDSSVIDVLVAASRAAREKERAIVLELGTAAVVERLLEIVSIEQLLPRAHGRQEALEIIAASRNGVAPARSDKQSRRPEVPDVLSRSNLRSVSEREHRVHVHLREPQRRRPD